MICFRCQCRNALFFENTTCLQCHAEVGYDRATNSMVQLTEEVQRCANGLKHAVCNWAVHSNAQDALCSSCQLNRTIPDLSHGENLVNWGNMESAKRRTLHTLLRLGIFPPNRKEKPDGLAFDFLLPTPGNPVLTGHKAGIITLNLLEASDAYRETQRHKLGEPYRTLVGHFRHELGHYYWDYFFKNSAVQEEAVQEFRQLFGDERADYAAALQRHYKEGPLADWNAAHVSAYAASHPWEDWAETWAQYLHIQDGLETARSYGWNSDLAVVPFTPFTPAQVGEPAGHVNSDFLKMLNDWVKLSPAINEIAAGLGFPNLYPFVLSAINARKLDFIHRVIKSATVSSPAPAM